MMDTSPATLVRLRLHALAREDHEIRTLAPAMHAIVSTMYAKLVQRGWEPCDALSAVLLELSAAQDHIARLALPE